MYDFKTVENKWQKYWDENKTFKTDTKDFSKPKYYALDMFPYPSGQGLHVGHPEGYTATDIMSRMKRMQGYNVLHPMGWDAFGLPAEQYAVKTGNHPEKFTKANIEVFKKQLKMLGFSYDWDREISTCDPHYYKWTQWIFKQLYNAGLVKLIDMPVNWCEELGTVLSNDEVIDGKSERGGFPVVRKNMKQWVMDIPAYAEKLLDGLNEVDWPESTKEIEKNWIGKSVGAEVKFKVKGSESKSNELNGDKASEDLSFVVFTTRPDTLFGATYCVLSPEHELVEKITAGEQKQAVAEYVEAAKRKSDLERTDLNKDKTGVFTGAYAINPVNNEELPIWISDYVLTTYGTGAIMAVPAHDQRDYEFAKKFDLPIKQVIKPVSDEVECNLDEKAFTDVATGELVNSDYLNGLSVNDAQEKIIAKLEAEGIGKAKTNYKLREWIFARQRYWGEPVPVVYTEDGKTHILPDDELPLVLPELEDYKPSKNGASPLEKKTDWVNTTFDGQPAKRETSTMPGSAGSSWYYLRYIDPNNDEVFADQELLKHWMPVDLYMGGPEHAVGHLLYARFWNNFLHDQGLSPVKEPFHKLRHQGMILGPNGEKMSKSKGNVINPDDMVNEYGADSLRLYEMFMGPIDAAKPWNPTGIEGSKKFLDRVWRVLVESEKVQEAENKKLEKVYNYTVKKVTNDYENMQFNTAISQMMIFINEAIQEDVIPKEYAEGFVQLLNPVAPHITEEIWEKLGHAESIAYSTWPTYDDSKTVDTEISLPVQINGKLRANVVITKDEAQESIKEKIYSNEKIKSYTDGKTVVKEIYVPNKIYNIVIK